MAGRLLRLTVIVLILLAANPFTAAAQDRAELEVDHALTFDFPTPHTDWAQPYALGKTRVLFFVDGRGTHPRECVELMQRFDLDAQAVFWARIVDTTKSHWHGGEVGEARMLELLHQKWDVFVFLDLPMTDVPSPQKQMILDAVAGGAGIVFVGTGDPALFVDENRLREQPLFLASPETAEAFRIGAGRGARIGGRPDIDYREGWEVDYDYWQERLGRAVLWAAGKEPAMQVSLGVSSQNVPSDRSAPQPVSDAPGRKLTVHVSGAPRDKKPVLRLTLRRPADEPFSWPPREVTADTQIELPLPDLPAGPYHADAIIMGSTGVETWATVPFEVAASRRVAEVRLDREWGEVGDAISGSVRLEGDPLPHELLRLVVLDRRRRELLRQDIAIEDNTAPFRFEVHEGLPMLATVEARVLSDGREASRAYRYFRVTTRRRDRFNFLVWDVPKGPLAPYAEESLARHGATLQLGRGNPPLYVSAFDMAWVPYTTRILNKLGPQGVMEPFCWNDQAAVRRQVAELATAHGESRAHGTFAYSLGDENKTLGSCLSPHCAAAYREYLEEVYGTVAALNSSWGTAFEAWEDVGLSRVGDNDEANSLREKNYPRWFDRQAFKSWNYVQYCRKYREAFREMDPEAITGFEGAGRFDRGDDLDLIVRSLDFWAPYPGLADEVIRSIAPRGFRRANWMGYTKDADSLLQKYWRMVMLGMDSVWWWRWECIGRFHGWLAPDLRPYPAVREILEDTRIVRDGLGDLLLRSEMQDDGIAILYSYPSVFAHKLGEGASYGGYEEAHRAVVKTLRDRGMQFRYVTDRMLRLGEFDASRFRLLILARAEALGDKEAEVIGRFVENGGTVLADVRPGLYNNHCKPRAKGALDDLFGITRAARPPAETTTSLQGALGHQARVDAGITANGATPAQQFGETPVLLVRKASRGTAVLLNCDASTLAELAGRMNAAENRGLPSTSVLTSVFAGVLPQITVKDGTGKHPADTQVARWVTGDTEIVGLFREKGPREEVTVALPEARAIRDLRSGQSLGPQERFTTPLIPSRAGFFVLSRSPNTH
jgi:beta-galactosidase